MFCSLQSPRLLGKKAPGTGFFLSFLSLQSSSSPSLPCLFGQQAPCLQQACPQCLPASCLLLPSSRKPGMPAPCQVRPACMSPHPDGLSSTIPLGMPFSLLVGSLSRFQPSLPGMVGRSALAGMAGSFGRQWGSGSLSASTPCQKAAPREVPLVLCLSCLPGNTLRGAMPHLKLVAGKPFWSGMSPPLPSSPAALPVFFSLPLEALVQVAACPGRHREAMVCLEGPFFLLSAMHVQEGARPILLFQEMSRENKSKSTPEGHAMPVCSPCPPPVPITHVHHSHSRMKLLQCLGKGMFIEPNSVPARYMLYICLPVGRAGRQVSHAMPACSLSCSGSMSHICPGNACLPVQASTKPACLPPACLPAQIELLPMPSWEAAASLTGMSASFLPPHQQQAAFFRSSHMPATVMVLMPWRLFHNACLPCLYI